MRTLLPCLLLACGTSTVPALDDTGPDDTPSVDSDTVDSAALDPFGAFPELDPAPCLGAAPDRSAGFDSTWSLPAPAVPLLDRILPLWSVLLRDEATRDALAADAAWADAAVETRAALTTAAACDGESICVASALELSTTVQASARERLVAVLGSDDSWVARVFTPSGLWPHLRDDAPAAAIGQAWDEAIEVTHTALRSQVWALPQDRLATVIEEADDAVGGGLVAPLAAVFVAGMAAAGRDEGARYEPLNVGENRAALERLTTLDLDTWPYALILVPGQGPTDLDTRLNPAGAARCDLAAARWEAGLAPFLLVSGGAVHPDGTRLSEAIEMKRYLMDDLGLPEDAILVDPYARHTTTNLRNASRTLLHAGVPPDTPFLVTTDILQSGYIASLVAPRSEEELGYVPWTTLARLDDNDSCVRVTTDALRVDGRDLRDP